MRLLKKCLQFFIWKEGEEGGGGGGGNLVCLFSLSDWTTRYIVYIYPTVEVVEQ